MIQDSVIAGGLLSFSPGVTTLGLLVWLLVALGVIGFLASIFKR